MVGDQHIGRAEMPVEHAAERRWIAIIGDDLQHCVQPRQGIGAVDLGTLRFQRVDHSVTIGGQDRRFCYDARNDHLEFP